MRTPAIPVRCAASRRPLHVHGNGCSTGGYPYRSGCWLNRRAPRLPERNSSDYCRSDWGLSADGGMSAIGAFFGAIIFGMVLIRVDPIPRSSGLVSGLSRRNAADRGASQFHSQACDRRALRFAMTTPIIEVRNLVKHFGPVIALNGVSLSVEPGQVHCLLSDNGAGKSTLIKTLSGVHKPTSGKLSD